MQRFLAGLVAAIVATVALYGVSEAQTQTRVGSQKDWAIFQAGDGNDKICWVATKPTRSSATRDGRNVDVRRGDIFLMVAVRPKDDAKNEVSFLAGYPFRKDSKVTATVGSSSFEMFTSGENAWTSGPDKDDQIVAAFRRGSSARLQGVSQRGTTTTDTFSLLGFTAALEEARKLCG